MPRSRPCLAFATTLMVLAAVPAVRAQQETWVDPSLGSDANPGTYGLPMRTLSYAASLAGPNHRIHLLPGLYGPLVNGETLPITLGSGVQQDNLVIRGIGNVVFDLGGSAAAMFRLASGANGCRITNLTITNSDQTGWWTRVINSGTGVNSANSAHNVEIDRCRFVNINRGIVLWTGDNTQGWRIHDNLFWNCTNDAILEYSGNNEISNNTFHTGTWKAYISDSATSICHNNLIVGCQIAFENNNAANNRARYQNNWLWQCPTSIVGPGLTGGLPASNTIGRDPMLTNPASGDFRPLPASPLLDAGTPQIFARADLDGVSRIVDSDRNGSLLPDIGAYESTPVNLTAGPAGPPGVLQLAVTSTVPNMLNVLVVSFDDGLVSVPGQPPILLDQTTLIPAYLFSIAPHTWYLNLTGVPPFAPGSRLVMQAFGFEPGVSLLASNQVWLQL